ncbi:MULTISPECIES: lipoprotein heptaprenylglyceryl N-acetyltransferase LhaT [Gracilibacillus]|uniref:DUF1405 domain-containing protein n=1 Tax=Gracilibacillus TaxID=74385 RepID=UPI0008262C3E|nr:MULTISPECIES: DUF1405 domain-containing protein [Gracilibacillus]
MIRKLLFHPITIALLFFINLIGTIYGYYWYNSQLQQTPAIFLAFVPDSPTASLFFTIFLLVLLLGKKAPTIEALAYTTLIKYGIWAVIMNLLTLYIEGSISWQSYMLIASHGAMALQAVLFAPLYTFKLKHLTIAGIWLLHNEIIDYVYGMMPIYYSLTSYQEHIGYFTFWLSVMVLLVAYHQVVKRNELVDA